MAIDSAQKRFSLLGLGSPIPRLLPIPQGTLEADDRALLLYLYAGLTLAEAIAAESETPSGGWARKHASFRRREQTAEDIKAERIRMGIIPPEPAEPSKSDAVDTTRAPAASGEALQAAERPYSLTSPLRPEDYRGIEELAARAATRTLDGIVDARIADLARDEELVRLLRLDEQLRDDDDAAVLMLAIATLH